jgi:hypothetical protein
MDEIKAYPLSNSDIEEILGPTKVFTYPDLADIENWEDAFDDQGRCVLLFLTEDRQTGHWIGLIRNDTTIEYFDPYGEPPEGDKKWLSKEKLRQLDEVQPYLTQLLRASGRRVYYNQHQFQSDRSDVNTCGRWVVSRLLLRKKTLPQFYKYVMKGAGDSKPDDFVSALTFKILGR